VTQIPASTKKTDAGHSKGAQPVPSCIEIACKQVGANGKQANFAFHGAYATAPPSLVTLAQSLFTAISGAWSSDLASLMVPASMFQAVWIRDMSNVNNPVVVGTGTAVPGTGSVPALPPEVAAVITENINARGRGMKGRVYIGGFAQAADAGNGVMSAAAQTGLSSFATAVFNAITSNSLTPCVAQPARLQYQGFTGTIHPARVAKTVTCSQYVLRNSEWDTQRRRGLNG
jgi:hypothetical protein